MVFGEVFGATPTGDPVRRVTIKWRRSCGQHPVLGRYSARFTAGRARCAADAGFRAFRRLSKISQLFRRDHWPPCQPHPRRPLQHRRQAICHRSRASREARVAWRAGRLCAPQLDDRGCGLRFRHTLLADPSGSMGFPGGLEARCTYRLSGEGALSLELTATADRPTLCNLTSHAYFNLDDGGETDTGDHRLTIFADAYLPVDEQLILTGEVRPVAGTEFDFRELRPIRPMPKADLVRYDNTFCLSAARRDLSPAARARGEKSGVEMEVWTTEPGVQFYAGHYVDLDAIGPAVAATSRSPVSAWKRRPGLIRPTTRISCKRFCAWWRRIGTSPSSGFGEVD